MQITDGLWFIMLDKSVCAENLIEISKTLRDIKNAESFLSFIYRYLIMI